MSNVFRKISHVFLRKSLNFIRSLGTNSGWVWRLWKRKVQKCRVCARARETRCGAYAVYGNSSNGLCRWTGTYPAFFASSRIILHCCIGELWVSIHKPTILTMVRSEGCERRKKLFGKKTLLKDLIAMCIYQNNLFKKKKVQFSGDFSLFAPLSTPICVGRWMIRKWGYEEE